MRLHLLKAQDKAICHCGSRLKAGRLFWTYRLFKARIDIGDSSGNYLAPSKGAYLARIWSAAIASPQQRKGGACIETRSIVPILYETVNVTITRRYLENKSVRDDEAEMGCKETSVLAMYPPFTRLLWVDIIARLRGERSCEMKTRIKVKISVSQSCECSLCFMHVDSAIERK